MADDRPAPLPELGYDSRDLIWRWRDRYAKSRSTVAHMMMNDAEALVREVVALEVAQAERDRHLAALNDVWQTDRLKTQLAAMTAERDDLLLKSVRLTQERAEQDGAVKVRINAPRAAMYASTSETTFARDWQLAEVEEVVYRLRVAGAEDSTPLSWTREHVEVVVPFPEYALAPAKRPVEDLPDPMHKAPEWVWLRPDHPLRTAAPYLIAGGVIVMFFAAIIAFGAWVTSW